jgi:hypothetical protein
MVTPPDIEAQILRFYHAERWTMGTIARQLHIHHSVVQRLTLCSSRFLNSRKTPATGPVVTRQLPEHVSVFRGCSPARRAHHGFPVVQTGYVGSTLDRPRW